MEAQSERLRRKILKVLDITSEDEIPSFNYVSVNKLSDNLNLMSFVYSE